MPNIQFTPTGNILFGATGQILFDCNCCAIDCAAESECEACGDKTPTGWSMDLEGVLHCCVYCDAFPGYDLAIVDVDDAGPVTEADLCLAHQAYDTECPQGYGNADAACRWAARFNVTERKFASSDESCDSVTNSATRTATAYLWHHDGAWTLHILVNRQNCPNVGHLHTIFHSQLTTTACPTTLSFANDLTAEECGTASTQCYTTGAITGGYDGSATLTKCCT